MKKPEDKLQQLVQRLQTTCGENLVSVVLYGSAAREDFNEQYSDVNLLLVVRELGASALHAIAPIIAWWTHEEKLRPPMIMTLQELQESADVFAIELLDIKTSHRTLAGEDVASHDRRPDEPASRGSGARVANHAVAAASTLAAGAGQNGRAACGAGKIDQQRGDAVPSCPDCAGGGHATRQAEAAGAGGRGLRLRRATDCVRFWSCATIPTSREACWSCIMRISRRLDG